jgi:hypothetical protein
LEKVALERSKLNQAALLEISPNQSAFDVRDQELQKPVVFRASFNRFEHINLSQA